MRNLTAQSGLRIMVHSNSLIAQMEERSPCHVSSLAA